jgi:hypothetical protein
MGKISKNLVLLTLIIVMPCLILPMVKPATPSSTPSAEPTPYQLLPPSTIAPPKNYSVPPLSSLSLTVHLIYGEACGGFVYIQGGSSNDINFKIINPEGKIIHDLGRISNETSFQFYADKTGNFTIILDNEFSVFSSKEVDVFSNSYPNNLFEFAGFSINFWAIILIIISLAALMTFIVWLRKRRK